MLASMTGFASSTITVTGPDGAQSNIDVNIKSLNSRYFETNIKLPYPLSHIETDIIKLLKTDLYRGYISCTIVVSNPTLFKGPVQAALPVAHSYVDAVELLQKKCRLPGTLHINDLISLPNIFIMAEAEVDETVLKKVLSTIKEVISTLCAVRKAEGQELLKDLQNRCVVVTKNIKEIERASAVLVAHTQQELEDHLARVSETTNELEESKSAQLYNELNKMDIHEEIVRFTTHLNNLEQQLVSDDSEKGRRLDFTLQELNREINTIAAKCSNAPISHQAINIKVELEKMREQVQNVV